MEKCECTLARGAFAFVVPAAAAAGFRPLGFVARDFRVAPRLAPLPLEGVPSKSLEKEESEEESEEMEEASSAGIVLEA